MPFGQISDCLRVFGRGRRGSVRPGRRCAAGGRRDSCGRCCPRAGTGPARPSRAVCREAGARAARGAVRDLWSTPARACRAADGHRGTVRSGTSRAPPSGHRRDGRGTGLPGRRGLRPPPGAEHAPCGGRGGGPAGPAPTGGKRNGERERAAGRTKRLCRGARSGPPARETVPPPGPGPPPAGNEAAASPGSLVQCSGPTHAGLMEPSAHPHAKAHEQAHGHMPGARFSAASTADSGRLRRAVRELARDWSTYTRTDTVPAIRATAP